VLVGLIGWTVDRVIVHEILLREDKERVPPVYGTALTQLDRRAEETFLGRVRSAIAKDGKCAEMDISKTSAESFFGRANVLLNSTDEADFIGAAKPIADLLAEAQASRAIPGGILIVFTGKVGHPARRYVSAIKAEAQDGFTRQRNEKGQLSLRLLNDLFLTPSSRMYKIGMFLENKRAEPPDSPKAQDFTAYVYDHLMSSKNREGAATYFYQSFLGCSIPQDAARSTKRFYLLTNGFIQALPIAEEEKFDLRSNARSYLRSNSQTIQAAEFADQFLPSDMADDYVNYMRENDFPTTAVSKELKDIAHQLKTRKITFRSAIKLQGPAEKMQELVTISKIAGEREADGTIPVWTQIVIKDRPVDTE
jgi:hypothetical protein